MSLSYYSSPYTRQHLPNMPTNPKTNGNNTLSKLPTTMI